MCCTSHRIFRSRYTTRLTDSYSTNQALRYAATYALGDGLAFSYYVRWRPAPDVAPVAEPVSPWTYAPEKEVVLVG